MGMNAKAVNYFFEILSVMRDSGFCKVCILGDQQLRQHARQFKEFDYATFKNLLEARGSTKRCESIDVNGRDGSTVLDLSLPIRAPGLLAGFDIVLNSGTSEHVMVNQWQVFKNMDGLLGDEGLLLHIVPEDARGHGFWYYDESFFEWLSRACGYAILDCRSTMPDYKYNRAKHYLFVTMRKDRESEFIDSDRWRDPLRDELGFKRYADGYESFMKGNLERANNG